MRSRQLFIVAIVVVVAILFAARPHIERSFIVVTCDANESEDPFKCAGDQLAGRLDGKGWFADQSRIFVTRADCESHLAAERERLEEEVMTESPATGCLEQHRFEWGY